MIKIMKLGDWATYQQQLGAIGPDLIKSASKSTYDFAEEVRNHIVWNIVSHGFRVARLKPVTVARKGHSLPFINTMGYVEHIKVLVDPEGFRVGFEEAAHNQMGKLYSEIADNLEYGTSLSPPRPHWRPTAAWAQKRLPGVGVSVLSSVRRG